MHDTNDNKFLLLHSVGNYEAADRAEPIAFVLDVDSRVTQARKPGKQFDGPMNLLIKAFGGLEVVLGNGVTNALDVRVGLSRDAVSHCDPFRR